MRSSFPWSKAGVVAAMLSASAAMADGPPLPPSAFEQVEAIDQWNSMTGPAPLGEDGRVILTYGAGPASLICAPNAICQIELGDGELVHDTPAIADPVRWNIELREAIFNGRERHIIIVKPSDLAETTVLALFTNKRSYSIRLVADPTRYTPRLAFRYPDEERAETDRRIAEARAAEELRQAEAAAAERALIESTGIQAGAAIVPAGQLNFDYQIAGRAPFTPTRIYDNGVQTFIQLPENYRRDMPIFMASSQGTDEAVNYRIDGTLFVIEGIFEQGLLVNGREQIRIRRR
ncbi:TrbG/VirB9 family P-type conjugative transfer protein [Roseobacter sp. HKCCA0434]|uniref:TrbG/VirB9 family P-type conjugative transfer protein n=1 Tax=Roseobacter sp. HKCCA0434 TaxID=3079297 RepID=UPI002905B45E|nr:TrbG/VirB9 family P-type conjugative transfer protein [Roseobacter sp. HKCCA0434]